VREGAGCFGYGENKQKGDNEGGVKPRPASPTRRVFIITNQRKKTRFFINFFHPVWIIHESRLLHMQGVSP